MKKPGLHGRIILSAAIPLLPAGILAFLIYSYFLGTAFASNWETRAAPLAIAVTGEVLKIEPVLDLSRMPQSWRQKLSKRIFTNIHHELKLLEQQKFLRNSAEGKRLIKKVRASLKKMQTGKRRFVRTGRELSLAPFYRGRTVLEYSLWRLKNLSDELNMDQAQSRGIYRVYALVNKWLVYVAHREISARRSGNIAPPQIADAEKAHDTESANQTFPEVSEVAKITEQDIEEANIALSKRPDPAKTTEPFFETESDAPPQTSDARGTAEPVVETENQIATQTSDVAETAEPVFENENSVATQTSDTAESAEPVIETENQASPQMPDMGETFEPVDETFESNIENGTMESPPVETGVVKETESDMILDREAGSSAPIADWMIVLGAVGIGIVAFLIFRRTRKSVDPASSGRVETYPYEDSSDPYTDYPASASLDEEIPTSTGDTSWSSLVVPVKDASDHYASELEETVEDSIVEEPALDNELEDSSSESEMEESVAEESVLDNEASEYTDSQVKNDEDDDEEDIGYQVEVSFTDDEAEDEVQEDTTREVEASATESEIEESASDHETIYYTTFKMEEPVTDEDTSERLASQIEEASSDIEDDDDVDEYKALQAKDKDSIVEESALDNELEEASSDIEDDDDVDEYMALQAKDKDSIIEEPALDNELEDSSPESEWEESVAEESNWENEAEDEVQESIASEDEESSPDSEAEEDETSESIASQVEKSASDHQADENAEEYMSSRTEDSTSDDETDETSEGMASQVEESATGITVKALVVDGVKENRDALSELLSSIGVEASGAKNVQRGMKHTESHHPDIIFWDAGVLNKKGRKALKAFQQQNGKDRYKMVVITDSDFDLQRVDNWNVKFHARLSKPIQKEDVLNCLQELLDREFDIEAEELRGDNEALDTEASPIAESYTEDEIQDPMVFPPDDSSEDSETEESVVEESDWDNEAPEYTDSQVTDDEAEDEIEEGIASQVEESSSDDEAADHMAFPPAESSTYDDMEEPVAEESFTDDEAEVQESIASEDEESSPDREAEDETSEYIASQAEESVSDDEEAIASHLEEPVTENSAFDDETTENITFSVIETSTNRETEESPAEDTAMDSSTDNKTVEDMVSQTKEWPANNDIAESGAEEPATDRAVKALVVDKVKKDRRALSELLSSLGVETSQAENVLEGMKHTRAHDPDIIFINTGLMDKNGRRSLRSLQKKEGEDRYKMVAITDSGFDPQRAEKWKLKFHDHLSQPFQEEDILNCLRELLEFGGEEPPVDSEAMADEVEENRDGSQAPVPKDQKTGDSDVLLLQTILKAAKGFRDINKRLVKIAEKRYAPAGKDSPEDSKEKD